MSAPRLPELPPNRFWRIKPGATTGYEIVELRQNTWYGSRLLKALSTLFPAGDIESAAKYILSSVERDEMIAARKKTLYGDYPPKRSGK